MNAHPSGEHVLNVKNLHVHYGMVCALKEVSFDVSCGTALALIGANGSGKSTLLKSIVGLVPQMRGEILWRGQAVEKSSFEIAYLPQREALDWEFPLTVAGLVESGRYSRLGPWKPFRKTDQEAVQQALESMQIQDLAKRHISALSGGQQQRAFIARALAQEPHVLLLDEPLNGLDRPSRELLVTLIKQWVKGGRLVIASHHDIHDAAEIFDQILLLKGQPVAFGTPEQVLTPEHMGAAFS